VKRGPALALIALLVLLSLVLWQRSALWRAAYPYLPGRVQTLPYRLRPAHTPVALPTPERGPVVAAPISLPATDAPPPSPPPTDAPRATPTAIPLPGAAQVAGIRHAYQRWNNCGPVTVAMALSAFGDTVDQMTAAQVLKPDPDDKNVGPEELAGFARQRGYGATVRVNGDLDRLRALVAAGLPVIAETWFIPKPGDEMGHYRLVTGYSDADGVILTADSYEGPEIRVPYDEFDRLWRVFNRSYVVAWPTDRAAAATELLRPDVDDQVMYVRAAAQAQAELSAEPDAFGWFNLGSSLVGLGDTAGAAHAFDEARAAGLPWRMLWYQFGPFEAYAAQDRWPDVRALAEANLKNAGNLEESLYWRGRARAALGDAAGATGDFQKAVSLNPNFTPAQEALSGAQ
jgi:hypothetical protein